MSSLPLVSFGIEVRTTKGYNQILRATGSYQALYQVQGARIADATMQLGVAQTYNSNSGETSSNIAVWTTGPLIFNGTRAAGGTVQLVINNMLVLDDEFLSWSLTNNGASEVNVSINMVNNTALELVDPVYWGSAVAPGSLTAGFIQGLAHSAYTGKNQTVTVNVPTGQSLYYAYPNTYVASQFSINGVSGGMTLAGIVTLTVPTGAQQYYVYQSSSTGIGNSTLVVTDA